MTESLSITSNQNGQLQVTSTKCMLWLHYPWVKKEIAKLHEPVIVRSALPAKQLMFFFLGGKIFFTYLIISFLNRSRIKHQVPGREPTYLSRCDMTVFEMSAPASCSIRMIWKGEPEFLPGWMITGQPSWTCACAAAWRTLFSLSVRGQEQPISPMTPHLMVVSSAPWRISLTSTSVSWGRGGRKMFNRWKNLSKPNYTELLILLAIS